MPTASATSGIAVAAAVAGALAGASFGGGDVAIEAAADAGAPIPTAAPELCNGLDDNGDGLTDEGLHVGDNCAVGEGACRRPGALRCAADPAAPPECNAVPGCVLSDGGG